jgi:hypothetical protein
MRLTQPLPTGFPTPAPLDGDAWWVETSDGRLCGLKAGGTAPVVNGLRMNYFCPDDTAIIGFPQEGRIWTARQVKAVQTPDLTAQETIIELRMVWR